MREFIKNFEKKHNVRLVNKKDSTFMKVLAVLLKPFTPMFLQLFYTTIRTPFQDKPTIYYPAGSNIIVYENTTLQHELMHAEQQRTTWGLIKSMLLYTIFPLPMFFSGRWFIEREPYLQDIKKDVLSLDWAVYILWNYYGKPWPRSWMRKWFKKKLEEEDNG